MFAQFRPLQKLTNAWFFLHQFNVLKMKKNLRKNRNALNAINWVLPLYIMRRAVRNCYKKTPTTYACCAKVSRTGYLRIGRLKGYPCFGQ